MTFRFQVGTCIGSRLAMKRLSLSNGGSGGIVVNISSLLGLISTDIENMESYHASKFGSIGLSKALGQKGTFRLPYILMKLVGIWIFVVLIARLEFA